MHVRVNILMMTKIPGARASRSLDLNWMTLELLLSSFVSFGCRMHLVLRFRAQLQEAWKNKANDHVLNTCDNNDYLVRMRP